MNKYYTDTQKLKAKIKELRGEISLAFQENYKLRSDISLMQQEYSLQIQDVQERHQQKLLRAKNDLENFINSLEEKITIKIRKESQELIEKIKNDYEEKIQNLKNEHEFEIINIQDNNHDDDMKNITDIVIKDVEEKHKQKIQEISLQYEERIKQIQREKGIQKMVKNKKVLEINNESENPQQEYQEKINSYEKHIKELRNIIESQEKNISEMSMSLNSSFKKKQPLSSYQVTKILQIFQYFFI